MVHGREPKILVSTAKDFTNLVNVRVEVTKYFTRYKNASKSIQNLTLLSSCCRIVRREKLHFAELTLRLECSCKKEGCDSLRFYCKALFSTSCYQLLLLALGLKPTARQRFYKNRCHFPPEESCDLLAGVELTTIPAHVRHTQATGPQRSLIAT